MDSTSHLLYASTYGGLSVINTQGTVTAADDTLVKTYTTATTPAIGSNYVYSSFLDSANNLLYVSTDGGLSVINTQGTVTATDDTLVKTYTTATTPAIGSNYVYSSFLDSANNLLYVSTDGGLSVINTQGTVTAADDTLVKTYTTATTPAIGNNNVQHSFLDSATNLLYVSTWGGGLSVINTQGTVTAADDTLVKTYTTATTPAIGYNHVDSSFLDSANNLLYVSTYGGGLSIINLNDEYNSEGEFVGTPQRITETPTDVLSFDRTQSDDQSTAIRYRTGDSDAAWVDDFDDDSTSEYAGDFYGWGGPFQNVVESDGTMKLSNPLGSKGADTWIDTGKPDGYFPIGSKVIVRMKINSNRVIDGTAFDWVFNDDWWDNSDGVQINNEWQRVSFTSSVAFSKIGFEIWWKDNIWNNATDNLEIDWIRIETPDSFGHWNPWSTPCTTPTSCPIDQADLTGNEWLQYRLDLTTSDPTTTPTVNSVTFSDGYESTGTFTSQDLPFSTTNELLSFTADTDVPEGTSLSFDYSLDHGTTWTPITPPHTFPTYTKGNSFQWRATFTTTDSNLTPILHTVTLSSTETNLDAFTGNLDDAEFSLGQDMFDDFDLSSKNYTQLSKPKLKGTNLQARNGEVSIYEKRGSKKKKIGTADVDENGDWDFRLPKSKDGEKTYYLRFTDAADNQTDYSKGITLIRDTAKPFFSPELKTALTLKRGGTLSFPATDNETDIAYYKVKLTPKRTTWRKQTASTYTLPEAITPGNYVFTIKAYDKAGNSTLREVAVRVW